MMRFFILILIIFFSNLETKSQSVAPKFNEGIYLSISQLLQNKPIVLRRIMTSLDTNSPAFYTSLIAKRKFTYIDDLGRKQTVPTDSILFVVNNKILYLNYNKELVPIPVVGSLCYFTALVQYYDYDMPQTNYFTYSEGMTVKEEERHFILDLNSGKIYDFNYKNLQEILSKYDKELYDEYVSLSKRKRKKLIFVYLRKFNEKHPLKIQQKQ